MSEYHKIDSVFKRDPATKNRTFIEGEWARPEFGYLADLLWRGTEKVDGTNIRISRSLIGGRSNNAQLPAKLVPTLTEIQDRLSLSALPESTILYGEGYGAGIQSGGIYRLDQGFILFDALINGNWQDRETLEGIANDLSLAIVPELQSLPLTTWIEGIRNRTAYEHSRVSQHEKIPNEGVVLRPLIELRDRRGERIITKLKFRDFPNV